MSTQPGNEKNQPLLRNEAKTTVTEKPEPDEIPKEIMELLKEKLLANDSESSNFSVLKHFSQRSFHCGPLPPPEMLKGYGEAEATAPDRILTMAESQQSHRMRMEEKIVNEDIAHNQRGFWASVGLMVLLLGMTIYFAWLGSWYAAAISGILPLLKISLEIIRELIDIFKPRDPGKRIAKK